jgi:diaminohydroxyphosphoribosylaminopyrimidine deaminase / 5-amino-6-(5-phosphoribosylamino)uracil reductase
MNYTSKDRKYMALAQKLALKGTGKVHPNPMVGAVIVNNGRIVGTGYHKYFGGPHAEVYALRAAGEKARGGSMYVTLEPCSHHGKTPPCADAIVRAGLKSVYIGMKDPNPLVSGDGIKKLTDNSIKTHVGLLKERTKSFKKTVIIKAAMTLDGKIASRTGDSRWISSPKSRDFVHKLRSGVDGILIGSGTAIKDNPALTSHGKGKDPVRILIDPKLKTPLNYNIFKRTAPVIVFYRRPAAAGGPPKLKAKLEALKRKGALTIEMPLKNRVLNFKHIIKKLNDMSVNSILIEGGGETIAAALKAKIADKLFVFIAPKLVGGRDAKTPVEGTGFPRISQSIPVRKWKARAMGPDILIEGALK